MQIRQLVIHDRGALQGALSALREIAPQWLLVFGAPAFFADHEFLASLRQAFPQALLSGCSTAGEISQQGCDDGVCVITAIHVDRSRITGASTLLQGMEDSRAAGIRIGTQLHSPTLRAVMVFGPGVQINGSAMVEGMASVIGEDIPLTGGLAGDGGAFRQTWTLGPDGISDQAIVAVGLHGEALSFCHGSFGGWEAFGPARKVTRCTGNVLFELDGAPALDVYKRYLGDYARDLPASGLLFPFAMLGGNHDEMGLIRSILGVNEADGSLTLAGDINPEGYLKLMQASTERLVGGAEKAAEAASRMGSCDQGLAVLVSCVGRKLVMGERVEEEVEAVADVFGRGASLTGFYSYGEICPTAPGVACRMHNQTMTVTFIAER